MEQRPANAGPSGNRPRGSAHAISQMQVSCQIRKAHESGNSRTNREEVPRRWSDSLQLRSGGGAIRPSGWSESPRGHVANMGAATRALARPRHAIAAECSCSENPSDRARHAHDSGRRRTSLSVAPPPIVDVLEVAVEPSIFQRAYVPFAGRRQAMELPA